MWVYKFLCVFIACGEVIFAVSVFETNIERSNFLEPKSLADDAEVFQRNTREYIFVNMNLTHSQAQIICNYTYNANLVVINSEYLSYYLSEALSEITIEMNTLWIGGILMNNTWYWSKGEQLLSPISANITKYFVQYPSSPESTTQRRCLAFSREDHDYPMFPALLCNAKRPMICERAARSSGNGSTHNGWIAVGSRIYKIFSERVTWATASAKCVEFDSNSSLAVITTYKAAQILGRYMLIGRPSLENAWIGAKYSDNNYIFEAENIILNNTTNANKFPPWNGGKISKPGGCLLLDRHVNTKTLFEETRCVRPRSYICYKLISDQHISDDIFINKTGYRIYFTKLPWVKAKDTCDMYKPKYGAKLAEIRQKQEINNLVYVMSQNKSVLPHIWLGGILNPELKMWIWDSDGMIIDLTNLNWIKNSTYFASLEQFNTCLNMDAENHLVAVHYGTICDYAQNFVCTFPKEKLEELLEDEQNIDNDTT